MRNGIQAHQDMFTSLATAAGVPDVVERVKAEKKQYIDGVNNLDYWSGKSAESARTTFPLEASSGGAHGAVEWHFSTKELYATWCPPAPLVFTIRWPVRDYDSRSYGHRSKRPGCWRPWANS